MPRQQSPNRGARDWCWYAPENAWEPLCCVQMEIPGKESRWASGGQREGGDGVGGRVKTVNDVDTLPPLSGISIVPRYVKFLVWELGPNMRRTEHVKQQDAHITPGVGLKPVGLYLDKNKNQNFGSEK